MLDYGFRGRINIDGEEVDKADLWQHPAEIKELIEVIIDEARGEVIRVGIATKDGMNDG